MIGKLHRLDPKDLKAFERVIELTAHPTVEEFRRELQNAVDLGLDFDLEEPRRVVLAGDAQSPAAKALLHAAQAVYQPNKVVLGTTGPVEPFARTLPAKDGQPVVYLCTGTACQPPTHDPEKVKQMLR